MSAAGGLTPYLWSISSGTLPTGLALDTSTGATMGTPTAAGKSSFTVKVIDANVTSATRALSITVR